MTPKEKAWDLNQKFIELQHYIENNAWNNSKRCALIAVDEMMEVYVSACVAMGMSKEDAEKQESKYLQEVKQEIEAL
jgi:hypothetical protein